MEKLLSIFFYVIINYKYERSNTMGFFSWITSEGESISNSFSDRGALPVYMYLPDDTKVYEDKYEGYGMFGGLDFYAEVAKLNAPEQCVGDIDTDRLLGIDLAFNRTKPRLIVPRFSIYRSTTYKKLSDPEVCPDQGYFYPDEEEEE
jgi:hypothetical protein